MSRETLQAAINSGQRFIIDRSDVGIVVPAAELYLSTGGIVHLDVGWNDPWPSRVMAHEIRGAIVQTAPNQWQLTTEDQRVIQIEAFDPERHPNEAREFARWDAFRASPLPQTAWNPPNRDNGKRYIDNALPWIEWPDAWQ